MPLPRKKDDGTGGAPVLDIMSAHVRLIDVEEHTEPYAVTRKSDGSQFELDPGFKCTMEIVGDGEDGAEDGTKFYESFKYKRGPDGEWFLKENSKLGSLTKVVAPEYFEDVSVPDLTADDLEAFEMRCRIKPKKNPNTGQVSGSTVDWETMRPLSKKRVTLAASRRNVLRISIPVPVEGRRKKGENLRRPCVPRRGKYGGGGGVDASPKRARSESIHRIAWKACSPKFGLLGKRPVGGGCTERQKLLRFLA